MNFKEFNLAIDKCKEYGLTEDKAINLTNEIIDIFKLEPEEKSIFEIINDLCD